MKKLKLFLYMISMLALSHGALAEIIIGGGKLNNVPSEQTLKFSLNALNPNFLYDVSCKLYAGGNSDAIIRFDLGGYNKGEEFGGIYFDDKALPTQQQQINGDHTVKYARVKTAGDGLFLLISYISGIYPVGIECYANPSTGF